MAVVCAITLTMAGMCRADQLAGKISAALEPLLITKSNADDAQQRDIMSMTTATPWGAVGFLDNGCTSTLIDSRHILAASHCFTFDYDGQESNGTPYLQGAWQRGLVFFPNYHPARTNPPRAQIDRVIVGSRIQSDPNVASDWGIAHLTSDVTNFPSLTLAPMEHWQYPSFVRFAGYARDEATYPNKAASFPQPAPGGYCANFGNNCWWIPAFVDPRCLAIEEENGFVRMDNFSCLVQGGNSGSPVIWNTGILSSSDWRITGLISGGGGFWNATRFQYAPRYAADVAVATFDSNTKRTQVFAIDSDLSRVVSRFRADTSVTGAFAYFRDLGSVSHPRSMAAVEQKNGKPLVIVTGTSAALSANYVGVNGTWQGWKKINGPSGLTGIRDICATADKNGVPHLYLVGSDFTLYTSRVSVTSSGITLGTWATINTGAKVTRVSAVRHGDGRQQVFVVTTTGALRSVWQTATRRATWSKPSTFSANPLSNLRDVSAGWTADGYVQVFAIDSNGDGWSRSSSGTSPSSTWDSWNTWSVPLYAPNAATPPRLDGIISITANRWRENSSKTVPAVFATDEQGNIYLSTYENGNWKPWRSFYN